MKIPLSKLRAGAQNINEGGRNSVTQARATTSPIPDPRAATTITIITSTQPARVCKAYTTRADGGLDKSAVANITEGIAQSYIVRTANEMARLLKTVATSDNKVIVPGRWHGDDGSPFFIYSKAKLAALLGVAEEDVPVGIVEHKGRRVAARLKAGIDPSGWVLLDADNPPGIPPDWAAKDIQQRLEMWEQMLPGIAQVGGVELRGSSARVVRNGEPSTSATHAWIRVSDPSKIALMKAYLSVEMVNRGLSFPFKKHSRTTGVVVGIEHRSVFDLAVFDTGRIVFCAEPDVRRAPRYRCDDADIAIVDGIDVLDLSALKLPDESALHSYGQKTGIKLAVSISGNGSLSTVSRGQLTLDTEIESRGVTKTLREHIVSMTPGDKVRCEAPFRESSSEAAFIGFDTKGEPFVFDIGNGVKYHLSDGTWWPGVADGAPDPLDGLVEATKVDPGAPFSPVALARLSELKVADRAAFERLRSALKSAGCRVAELDDAIPDYGVDHRTGQADVLLQLSEVAELFHTSDGAAYADVEVNGHRATYPVRSRDFKRFLTRRYYEQTRGAPNAEALNAALSAIEARAVFDGPDRAVHVRVGAADGKLYLDLGDDTWHAVEIDNVGWRLVERPPVRFRRSASSLPLPVPTVGGSIEDLRPLLNVSDDDFDLAVAWVLAGLRPTGPYPVLILAGEHGSAKSTFAATVRNLIDPHKASQRTLPRQERDLFIAANNSHIQAYDNVSFLSGDISDALCRIATGGGFATRQLYTDGDETLFDVVRPIILNGIEDFVTRPDLADRAVFLTLESIADENRRTEEEMRAACDATRPGILGALLDIMVVGLRRLPEVRLAKLPRMADFALWVTACEPAYTAKGAFVNAGVKMHRRPE